MAKRLHTYRKVGDKFAIFNEHGRQIDWPLLNTESEARKECREFDQAAVDVYEEEMSERRAFGWQ